MHGPSFHMMVSLVIDNTLAAGPVSAATGPGRPASASSVRKTARYGGEPQRVSTGRQVGESSSQASGCAIQKGRTDRGNITAQARASLELVQKM